MFKQDLDGILNNFSATLTKLKNFVENKESEIVSHIENLNDVKKLHAEATAAKERAEKIIQNLAKLLEAA